MADEKTEQAVRREETKSPAAEHVGPAQLPLINRVLYLIGWWLLHLGGTIFLRYRSFGMKNVPLDGPLIVVCNHQSNLDPPLMGVALRRKNLNFIARVGLFKNPLFGWLIRTVNAIPIRRGESDLPAVKQALTRLEHGHAVVVFAEGERTLDGAMHEFQRGLTLLLKRSRCPVLPVGIEGFYDAWPRGAALPRFFGPQVVVEIGEPISHDELLEAGAEEGLKKAARAVDELRLRCRARLKQHTQDAYPRPNAGDAPTPIDLWYTPESPDATRERIKD